MSPSPPRRRAGWHARLLGWVLLVPLLLGLAIGVRAPSASATSPSVTVTIGSMTPASVSLSEPAARRLSITGTLANTSGADLSQVQVYLWRDTTPITTESGLHDYLASDPGTPLGRRAVDSEKGVYQFITSDAQPRFVAGQSASFTVSAELDRLGFTQPGVYPVGVQVRAVTPGDQQTHTVGRARTMVSVQASGAAALAYSPVVVLTSAPSLLSGSTFADNHLSVELGGRLHRLLARAAVSGSTPLVDPALVDEVEVLTHAHTVVGTTLTTAQQRATASVARAWLTQLAAVIGRRHGYRLPYANADLAVPLAAQDAAARDQVATATTGVSSTSNARRDEVRTLVTALPLAVLPSSHTLSASWLGFVQPLHPALVLSPETASGVDPITGIALRALTPVADGGPGPDPQVTTVQTRSLLLAQALLSQLSGGSPPAVEVADDADLGVTAAAGSSVRASAVALPRGSVKVPASGSLPSVDTWMRSAQSADEALTAWGEVTAQPQASQLRSAQATARSMSASWLNPEQGASFLDAAVAQTGDVLHDNLVHATMSKEFVLASDTNVLPATVHNNLDSTVQVKMSFVSENPQRIRIADTAVITVKPHETAPLHFSPKASTNGAVTVMAQLETPQGRPIGNRIRITVRATSFGQVGWVIVVASGVVFMGLTTWRIRQVQRERLQERAARHEARTQAAGFPDAPPSGQTGGQAVPGPASGRAAPEPDERGAADE